MYNDVAISREFFSKEEQLDFSRKKRACEILSMWYTGMQKQYVKFYNKEGTDHGII